MQLNKQIEGQIFWENFYIDAPGEEYRDANRAEMVFNKFWREFENESFSRSLYLVQSNFKHNGRHFSINFPTCEIILFYAPASVILRKIIEKEFISKAFDPNFKIINETNAKNVEYQEKYINEIILKNAFTIYPKTYKKINLTNRDETILTEYNLLFLEQYSRIKNHRYRVFHDRQKS